uniref:Uncharacterized protein n=1 Tax=Eutreptiella gymnastica TaxID=73025 RepID=A0A7S4FZU1_9EUGL
MHNAQAPEDQGRTKVSDHNRCIVETCDSLNRLLSDVLPSCHDTCAGLDILKLRGSWDYDCKSLLQNHQDLLYMAAQSSTGFLHEQQRPGLALNIATHQEILIHAIQSSALSLAYHRELVASLSEALMPSATQLEAHCQLQRSQQLLQEHQQLLQLAVRSSDVAMRGGQSSRSLVQDIALASSLAAAPNVGIPAKGAAPCPTTSPGSSISGTISPTQSTATPPTPTASMLQAKLDSLVSSADT